MQTGGRSAVDGLQRWSRAGRMSGWRLGLVLPLVWLPVCVRQYFSPAPDPVLDRHTLYTLQLGHIFHLVWGTEVALLTNLTNDMR